MSIKHISHIPIYVFDQEEACAWYCDKLGFQVFDDNSQYVPGYRWLTVGPDGNRSTQFILMPVRSPADRSRVGSNGMCVLLSDDCQSDCKEFHRRGVTIVSEPIQVPWGISAVIQDLYGNPYNLVQR